MTASNDLARAVLAPGSIVLIGASADENTHSSLLQRYLRRHGYAGDVFPINRRRADRGRHGGRAAKAARRVPAPPPPRPRWCCSRRQESPRSAPPRAAPTRCAPSLSGGPPRAGEPRPAFAPLGRAARPLNAADSARVVAALGVRVVDHVVLPANPAALDARSLASLTFPVVAKILSRDIPHKTEAGGIALGIATREALREACANILASVAAEHPTAASTASRSRA